MFSDINHSEFLSGYSADGNDDDDNDANDEMVSRDDASFILKSGGSSLSFT